MKADLTSHRIEGYLPSGKQVDLPLYSEVLPNLWQGGCIEGVCLLPEFKHVLSLYKWESYTLPPDTERLTVTMYDSLNDMAGREELIELAEWVNDRRKRGRTLVHCQAGINRSALVCGLALILDGMPSGDAITLLRKQRSELVLANKSFEAFLVGFER